MSTLTVSGMQGTFIAGRPLRHARVYHHDEERWHRSFSDLRLIMLRRASVPLKSMRGAAQETRASLDGQIGKSAFKHHEGCTGALCMYPKKRSAGASDLGRPGAFPGTYSVERLVSQRRSLPQSTEVGHLQRGARNREKEET
jgi:hypothetical protein